MNPAVRGSDAGMKTTGSSCVISLATVGFDVPGRYDDIHFLLI